MTDWELNKRRERQEGSKVFPLARVGRRVTAVAGCGLVLVLIAASVGGAASAGVSKRSGRSAGGFKLASYIANDAKQGKKLVIRVDYHDPSLAFATPLRAGVAQAAKHFGVDAQLIGPASGSAADQVNQLQTLIIQKKVDGIAVSSASNDALKPVIAQAYNAGIPIVSFNTDNPGSKQMAFIGQDLVYSGKVEGQQLVKLLHGRKGKVVVFSVDSGAGWSHDRFKGFMEGVKGAGLKIVGPVNTGNEPNQSYNTVQSTMTSNGDAVAIASLDCCSFDAAGKWVQLSHKAGKITVVGFDFLKVTAGYLASGVVQATIDQNPVLQGYQAVAVLVDYLKNHTPIKNVNTGVKLITKANMKGIPTEG